MDGQESPDASVTVKYQATGRTSNASNGQEGAEQRGDRLIGLVVRRWKCNCGVFITMGGY